MTDGQKLDQLKELATLVRYESLSCSTAAGSGHPTSSLSATDLMVGLMFGGAFRYDVDRPEHPNNDRLVFSKGHASPLFYSLWLAAGKVSEEELATYRKFGSPLEGHPSVAFPYTEAATGSLGQGLSIGVGMALNAKYLDKLPYRTYILLGDSEMAEGSQWEAMEIAAYYELGNLTGIIDVNRLGQRGETMYGWDLDVYRRRVEAFGWEATEIDGHDFPAILDAYRWAATGSPDRPTMIIARTIKGKGVPEVENKNGWHGKPLDEAMFEEAVKDLGPVDRDARGKIPKPEDLRPARAAGTAGAEPAAAGAAGAAATSAGAAPASGGAPSLDYPKDQPVATRHAYGNALVRLYGQFPEIVCLDGEVSNSTGADRFKKAHPERFFEMYIAEQNMAAAALGLAKRGNVPFASTFAAFWTRAFDQIRMASYSEGNIKFVGSHAGVSIGQDGPSQMGLEDIAMFRTLRDSAVLHPCDAISTEKLVEEMVRRPGIAYLRTLRQETPIVYPANEEFPIGGSKVLRRSDDDAATIVAAGATVFEALGAADQLAAQGIALRVIDAYSIQPIDGTTLREAAEETPVIITVEDHGAAGGLGEAVLSALADAGAVPGMPIEDDTGIGVYVAAAVQVLAVRRKPMSGGGAELRDYEEISAGAIARKVKELLGAA
jgi:transketolase